MIGGAWHTVNCVPSGTILSHFNANPFLTTSALALIFPRHTSRDIVLCFLFVVRQILLFFFYFFLWTHTLFFSWGRNIIIRSQPLARQRLHCRLDLSYLDGIHDMPPSDHITNRALRVASCSGFGFVFFDFRNSGKAGQAFRYLIPF